MDETITKIMTARACLQSARTATMMLQRPRHEQKGGSEILDFETCCQELRGIFSWSRAKADWTAFKANAKGAAKRGTATALQTSCLLMKEEINDYVDMLSKASSMCKPRVAVEPGVKEWHEYPESVRQMVGISVDERTLELTEHTAAEYTDTRLHKKKTAWLVHKSGHGKSMLQGAWGRLFCRRYNADQYISGKSLDPMGIMTKHGEMENKGALMLADLNMKSLMNQRLTVEEEKGLLQVYEAAHLPGRYHQAIIPAGMPRTISVNLGNRVDVLGNTVPDPGYYFDYEGMPALAAMARRDAEALRNCTDNDIAVAHRCVVFVVSGGLDLAVDREALDEALDDEVAEGIEQERRFLAALNA